MQPAKPPPSSLKLCLSARVRTSSSLETVFCYDLLRDLIRTELRSVLHLFEDAAGKAVSIFTKALPFGKSADIIFFRDCVLLQSLV